MPDQLTVGVDDQLTVGVDLGGTKIMVAAVDAQHRVLADHKMDTPTGGPSAVVDAIVGAVREVGHGPIAVGVGAPGPVQDGVVVTAPNLVGWRGPVGLRELLCAALGVPVVVGNDANVGAIGEWVAGAGRGARFLLGVWMGTGVGGGLVLDGRPFDGAFGAAGEFGHMVVRAGGERCGCGRRGCVEAYAGRAKLEQAVALLDRSGRTSALTEIAAAKGKDRLTSSVWARALAAADPVATALLTEAIEAVGIGVAAAVNLLDLDRVVIGGGFAERLGQDLADRVASAAQPYILSPNPARRVVAAELAEHAGVIGAAHLARDAA